MIILGASELARINSSVRGVAWAVDLAFTSGAVKVTTAPMDLIDGSGTYIALGGFAGISQISESENAGHDKLTLSLSVTNSSFLALALGSVSSYRNKRVTLHLALYDETFQIVGVKITRWIGIMDTVSIQRNADGGTVAMECSRSGMPKARNREGLRLTFAQQEKKYPGDTGLRYVTKLIQEPTVWLSKRFQEV